MPNVYKYPVSYREFCQRVRRHAPSDLLPVISRLAAKFGEPGEWLQSPYKKLTPWALAEVARVSLVFGNEYRREPVTEDDVIFCCAAHIAITERDLQTGTIDGFLKFMLRLANEQLPYQEPPLHEWARSIAIFEQTTTSRTLEVLTNNWATELLGCSIREYVGISFFAQAAALNNAGMIDLAWLNQDNFAFVRRIIATETIRHVLERNFIATPAQLRTLQPNLAAKQQSEMRRYLFNPLFSKPIINGMTDHLLVPAPGLLVRKSSQLGIYYSGTDHWGNRFARDVGHLFESYVGRQLQLAHGASVYPAIKYEKDQCESVDWIVVFDEVVVLDFRTSDVSLDRQ